MKKFLLEKNIFGGVHCFYGSRGYGKSYFERKYKDEKKRLKRRN